MYFELVNKSFWLASMLRDSKFAGIYKYLCTYYNPAHFIMIRDRYDLPETRLACSKDVTACSVKESILP